MSKMTKCEEILCIVSDLIDRVYNNPNMAEREEIVSYLKVKRGNKMKSDIDGTLDMSEIVDIIVSGYEWICPKCEHFNTEIEYTEQVQCFMCERVFLTNPPEHAMG